MSEKTLNQANVDPLFNKQGRGGVPETMRCQVRLDHQIFRNRSQAFSKGGRGQFTPPFETTEQEPGYIKGYPPGVRENGGQYTHAATWFVLALAQLGRGDDAYHAFNMLNPVNHALNEAKADTYRVEPYVVAADVYSQGDKAGIGGWTWYTGSAGWLYRAAVEGILGISRTARTLDVKPCLPSHWDGFEFSMTIDGATYAIRVERGPAPKILLNGVAVTQIELARDGHHEVVVTIGLRDENPASEAETRLLQPDASHVRS